MTKSNSFRDLPIATKLNLILAGSLVALFLVGVITLSSWLSKTLEQRQIQELEKTNGVLLSLMNAYSESLEKSVQQHAASLGLQFEGAFSLEPGQTVEVEGKPTPMLKLNGVVVNGRYGQIDRFTAANGVVATIFARQDEDFVRVTTSLKKEDGSRAVATALGSAHPAHTSLLRGDSYTGKARLFGRDYMTHYLPIKDGAGKTIAVLFVGLDFTDGLKALKQRILALKVGQTGYIFALDAGKDKGTLTIHPAKEGANILASKDANGREFIKEMLEMKNGVIRYDWKNEERGEKVPREKLTVASHFEKWNWVIGSGSYIDEFTQEVAAVRNRIAIGGLVMVLIALALVHFISRQWIALPLKNVVKVMERIAEGDLTGQIRPASNDEVGQLLAATGQMSENLRVAITEIHQAAENLAASSDQLNVASEEVAEGSRTQSQAAESMAASVEEMTASIQQVADHARSARDMSAAAGESSSEGAQVIDGAAQEMTKIATSVKAASQTVTMLGTRSDEISAIVNVIKEIADQTNLLALNAAIEAARAGEQGRGFAVVADEVRKLAERTSQSTQEISVMIESIQSGTQEAVASMDTGVAQVEDGVQYAHRAGDSIARIRTEASQVAEAVDGISIALGEQSAASNLIAENVSQIVLQAEANHTNAAQTAEAANRLQALANSLKTSVSHFKV